MAYARPASAGSWSRPADPNAGAGTDYSTWIELVPASAVAASDPNTILTSNAYDATGWEFVIAGTSGAYILPSTGAALVFNPVDADGAAVSLAGAFSVEFRIDYVTQPSAGSDIALIAGIVNGTTFGSSNRWIGFGSRWDTAASGPDQVFSYYQTHLYSGAAAVDAAGSTYVSISPVLYDSTSSRWEPSGGYAAWMLRGSTPTNADQLKAATTTNFDLGSSPNLFLCIGEGVSAETIKVQVYYRVIPAYDEGTP